MELPSQPELTEAWRTIRTGLRATVGESAFEIWFRPLEAHRWDGTVLTLGAPKETQRWVAERFGRVLERHVRDMFGPRARISFTDEHTGATAVGAAESTSRPHSEPATSFNPRYSFDQFVMGDTNRLAHAAALAVAENPGHAYNPLFLYGPPGLGKTHLLHAIGNYLSAFSADHRALYNR